MTEPTCRTCYVYTLSGDERDRFLAEPVGTSIHYCPEHQEMVNNLLDSFNWGHVVIHGSVTGRFPSDPPEFQQVSGHD